MQVTGGAEAAYAMLRRAVDSFEKVAPMTSEHRLVARSSYYSGLSMARQAQELIGAVPGRAHLAEHLDAAIGAATPRPGSLIEPAAAFLEAVRPVVVELSPVSQRLDKILVREAASWTQAEIDEVSSLVAGPDLASTPALTRTFTSGAHTRTLDESVRALASTHSEDDLRLVDRHAASWRLERLEGRSPSALESRFDEVFAKPAQEWSTLELNDLRAIVEDVPVSQGLHPSIGKTYVVGGQHLGLAESLERISTTADETALNAANRFAASWRLAQGGDHDLAAVTARLDEVFATPAEDWTTMQVHDLRAIFEDLPGGVRPDVPGAPYVHKGTELTLTRTLDFLTTTRDRYDFASANGYAASWRLSRGPEVTRESLSARVDERFALPAEEWTPAQVHELRAIFSGTPEDVRPFVYGGSHTVGNEELTLAKTLDYMATTHDATDLDVSNRFAATWRLAREASEDPSRLLARLDETFASPAEDWTAQQVQELRAIFNDLPEELRPHVPGAPYVHKGKALTLTRTLDFLTTTRDRYDFASANGYAASWRLSRGPEVTRETLSARVDELFALPAEEWTPAQVHELRAIFSGTPGDKRPFVYGGSHTVGSEELTLAKTLDYMATTHDANDLAVSNRYAAAWRSARQPSAEAEEAARSVEQLFLRDSSTWSASEIVELRQQLYDLPDDVRPQFGPERLPGINLRLHAAHHEEEGMRYTLREVVDWMAKTHDSRDLQMSNMYAEAWLLQRGSARSELVDVLRRRVADPDVVAAGPGGRLPTDVSVSMVRDEFLGDSTGLERAARAGSLVDLVYTNRELKVLLGEIEQHLPASADGAQAQLLEQARTLTRNNLGRMDGIVPAGEHHGMRNHVRYDEMGRIRSMTSLLHRLQDAVGPATEVAGPTGSLNW